MQIGTSITYYSQAHYTCHQHNCELTCSSVLLTYDINVSKIITIFNNHNQKGATSMTNCCVYDTGKENKIHPCYTNKR